MRVTSEETQAAIYAEMVRFVACDPDVAQLNFFGYYDERNRGGWQSALRRADGSERPANAQSPRRSPPAARRESANWTPLAKPEGAAVEFARLERQGEGPEARRPLHADRRRGRHRQGRLRARLDAEGADPGLARGRRPRRREPAPPRTANATVSATAADARGRARRCDEPRACGDLHEPGVQRWRPLRRRSRSPPRRRPRRRRARRSRSSPRSAADGRALESRHAPRPPQGRTHRRRAPARRFLRRARRRRDRALDHRARGRAGGDRDDPAGQAGGAGGAAPTLDSEHVFVYHGEHMFDGFSSSLRSAFCSGPRSRAPRTRPGRSGATSCSRPTRSGRSPRAGTPTRGRGCGRSGSETACAGTTIVPGQVLVLP